MQFPEIPGWVWLVIIGIAGAFAFYAALPNIGLLPFVIGLIIVGFGGLFKFIGDHEWVPTIVVALVLVVLFAIAISMTNSQFQDVLREQQSTPTRTP